MASARYSARWPARNSLGVPAAYLLAGAAEMAAGLTGMAYGRLRPQALDTARSELAGSEYRGQG